jgi:hypothetical protein
MPKYIAMPKFPKPFLLPVHHQTTVSLLPKSLLHLRYNTLFKTGVLEIMVKIGYVRISRDNQNPESQIKLMKDMGIVDNDIFVDRGMSGWIEPNVRPVYKDMMKRLTDPQKLGVFTIIQE